MVHRSLLRWLPTPSVTHVLFTEQYCEPETICHMYPAAVGGGGDGDGGGGGGGGGRGAGGGGDRGGKTAGVVVPQMTKPPLLTDPSEYHTIVEPACMRTFDGPEVPL